MIHSLEIHNFKNLRNLEMDLEPLTVLVGANGSGKTSVLEAIHLAVQRRGRPHGKALQGRAALRLAVHARRTRGPIHRLPDAVR